MKILLLLLLSINLYSISVNDLKTSTRKKFERVDVKVYYLGTCSQNGYDKKTGHLWVLDPYSGMGLMHTSSFQTKVKDQYHIYKVVKGSKVLWYAFKNKLRGSNV